MYSNSTDTTKTTQSTTNTPSTTRTQIYQKGPYLLAGHADFDNHVAKSSSTIHFPALSTLSAPQDLGVPHLFHNGFATLLSNTTAGCQLCSSYKFQYRPKPAGGKRDGCRFVHRSFVICTRLHG